MEVPMRALLLLSSLGACAEPLLVPGDPATSEMPVGVQTLVLGGETVEVWYPARGEPSSETDTVDLAEQLPEAFRERVPEVDPPSFPQAADRDAEVRRLAEPVSLVVFSHGFGGFRTQSATLTTHLAARGFVVVSSDHPGRRLADLVGCLVTPPAGSCDLGPLAGGTDPGPEDVENVLDALPDALPEDLAAIVDPTRLGMFGHSAGGGTTTRVGTDDASVIAALTMAGGGSFGRELPSLSVGGACDATVPDARLAEEASTSEGHLSLAGAGHLAFSDLCRVDLGAIADQIAARDDANGLVLEGLRGLATDGCPGAVPDTSLEGCEAEAFLDQDRADAILRDVVGRFFEATLRDGTTTVDASRYEEATLLAP